MTAQASVRKERWFAAFMVVASALLLAQAFRYAPESSLFPRFLMILQLVFSIMLLVQALRLPSGGRQRGPDAPQAGSADTLASLYAPFKVFVSVSLYIVAIGYLGYFVATALFLCAAMFWFGSRRPLVVVAVSGGFLIIVYALFVTFMGVRLPQGLLF